MTVRTDVTPLVISYGGVLRGLISGAIAVSELDGGIFYFGCTREHFYDDQSWMLESGLNTVVSTLHKQELYRQLRSLVEAAEASGRVAWRTADRSNSWAGLNDLLARNGLPVMDSPVDLDWPGVSRYSYPAVAETVRRQGLPYEVIPNY